MQAEDSHETASEPDEGPSQPAKSPVRPILLLAGLILFLDQTTKLLIQSAIEYGGAIEVLPGFFRLVHWGNTGAAWSLFHDSNTTLAVVSSVALVVLFYFRDHFEAHIPAGRLALGLIFGGILGNLVDRIAHQHVVDFLYFYLEKPNGAEAGFPAFNVADSAICVGVGILFLLAWRNDSTDKPGQETEESR